MRAGGPADAEAIGRLLHDFNREYDDPTPPPEALAVRVRELMGADEITVLLAVGTPGPQGSAATDRANGADPAGLAVLRFRPAIWTRGLECYLAELYVVPARRGHGLGRALMDAALELARERGADWMELNTAETDTAARALYESLGFTNTEGKLGGPVNYYYERDL